MSIPLTVQQLEACEHVLRAAGYSQAWLAPSDDFTETTFLVKENELDWVAPYESSAMNATVRKLAKELPGTKVYLLAYRRDVPVVALY